jgi:hypothetical protein
MDINGDGIDEFSIWNINSVLGHIKDNIVSFILLICVFFIIYIVDHLSNYNMMLMTMASIPVAGIPPILKKRKHKRLS